MIFSALGAIKGGVKNLALELTEGGWNRQEGASSG
jgi:hypothetical protein